MGTKQEKPDWALTKVGWEIRKVIWLHWAMGETLTQTAKYLQLHADEFPNCQYHIDTIRKVRKELLSMPVELLGKLVKEVPELKSFVEEKRIDYKSKTTDKAAVKISHIEESDYIHALQRIRDHYKNIDPSLSPEALIDHSEKPEP